MELPWYEAPTDFWSRLPSATQSRLEQIGAPLTFTPGDTIFASGEMADNVYLLRQGRVKIYSLSPVGSVVILWFCLPGELFGLAEMTRAEQREVCAESCTDSSILVIPLQRFKTFIEENPAAAIQVIDLLSCRLRSLGDMLLNLSTDDVMTRVIKLLCRLHTRYGKTCSSSGGKIDMPVTHQEIADMIGTTRQSASTVLNQFKRQEIIDIKQHHIYLRSVRQLKEMMYHHSTASSAALTTPAAITATNKTLQSA